MTILQQTPGAVLVVPFEGSGGGRGNNTTTNSSTIGNMEAVVVEQPIRTISVPIVRMIVDGALLIGGIVAMVLVNDVTPFQRGFYCDDDTIRYPYKRDTISSTANHTAGGVIVVLVILILECFHAFSRSSKTNSRNPTKYTVKGKAIHPLLSSLYIYVGYALLGVVFTIFTTNFIKVFVGRLRPHFLDLCHPDWSKLDCGNPTLHVYVQEPYCNGTDLYRLKDARMSFLSGHSSYAAFVMVFAALYVHARWPWSHFSRLGKHYFQLLLVLYALFVGLSRVSDYKHHWSDVLAGYALGTLLANLTAIHFGKFFARERIVRGWAASGQWDAGGTKCV